jgi:hypothetical protein
MKVATILLCVFVLNGRESDAIGFDTIVGVKNTTSGEFQKPQWKLKANETL